MIQDTGDVRYLAILDSYEQLPDIDLSNEWYDIYEQWSEIIGGNRSLLSITKQKTLLAMKHKFSYQMQLLNIVKTLPVDELIQLLTDEGYKIDKEDLDTSFKVVYGKLMQKKGLIDLEEKDEVQEKGKGFGSLIGEIEKYQGYHFDQKEMMVSHFAEIYINYKEDGKRRQNKKK